MPSRAKTLLSLLCLAILMAGSGYALGRERSRPVTLHDLYLQINRESFGGQLPDVPVTWSDLTKDQAYAVTHFDHGVPFSMEIDRATVKSESFALDVIRHEGCHISTLQQVKQRHEDPHGPTFYACMSRIQQTVPAD